MNHKVAFSFADGKTLFFDVGPNEILLDAALRNGVNIPLDCREGVCGTCQGRCESGEYEQDYVDEETLSSDDLAQRKMLSCQTRVRSDASFYFDFDSSLCRAASTDLVTATIAGLQQVSDSTAILHLDGSSTARRLNYLPGQYARSHVPVRGHGVAIRLRIGRTTATSCGSWSVKGYSMPAIDHRNVTVPLRVLAGVE